MVKPPTPEMKKFRQEIDEIDIEIARLMGARFDIIRKVAEHKKQKGIPAVLPDRVDQVIENARDLALEYNLDADLMGHLYQLIVKYACEFENTVIEN